MWPSLSGSADGARGVWACARWAGWRRASPSPGALPCEDEAHFPLSLHQLWVDIWVCSHPLAVKSNAALNILVQIFKGKYKDVNGANKGAGVWPSGMIFPVSSIFSCFLSNMAQGSRSRNDDEFMVLVKVRREPVFAGARGASWSRRQRARAQFPEVSSFPCVPITAHFGPGWTGARELPCRLGDF